MKSYEFSKLPKAFSWRGATDFDERKNGISPRRLPKWTRPQVPQEMEWVVRTPSGVRLLFSTDATRIDIHALATNTVMPPHTKRPVVFDLVCDGVTYSHSSLEGTTIMLNRRDPSDINIQRGEPDIWSFADLPKGYKQCELWLPHNAVVELREIRFADDSTVAAFSEDHRSKWIHYGSSISHCMEAIQPSLTWPAVAAKALNWNLQSLGFGGQCHLDPFIAKTIAESDADIISAKIGINVINLDSMRERVFTPLLHGFLDTIRRDKPQTPIVLISPIYCPAAETHPGPTLPDDNGVFQIVDRPKVLANGSLSLCRVREIVNKVVEARDDPNLYYLSGLSLFSADDAADLPDALHPNPEGYLRMGERFAQNAQFYDISSPLSK